MLLRSELKAGAAGGEGGQAAKTDSVLFPAYPLTGTRDFFVLEGGADMAEETRIALAGILVEDPFSVEKVNGILHDFAPWIIGRMGIPCRSRGVNIISVVLDAAPEKIGALSGKLGMLPGIQVKTLYTKNTSGNRKGD